MGRNSKRYFVRAGVHAERRVHAWGEAARHERGLLYLNIWTPTKATDERLPVIVWIHGGGYVNGSASMPPVRPTSMKRTLFGLGAMFFSCFLMAAAKAPEREVEDNRLISKGDPAITIHVPRSAVYLGAERWDLYDVADCELHLFVEAYPDKTVKAMYWIQFEAFLPTNEHTYDYTKDEPVTFAGRLFWKRSDFGPTNNIPRAGSDGERTRQMLARAGYKLPTERMNVRLVHVLDESRRKELMVIYSEDLAPSGYTASQLLDGNEPRLEWKDVEQGLVERAMKRIKLSHPDRG